METDRKEATAKGTVVEGEGKGEISKEELWGISGKDHLHGQRASSYLPGKGRGTVCGQEEEIHNPCHL